MDARHQHMINVVERLLQMTLVKTQVPPTVTGEDAKLWARVVLLAFIYAVLGLLVSCAFIIAGLILTILGISGDITWIVEANGFTSKLFNATPGVVLFICGIATIFITRYEVRAVINKGDG